MILPQDTKEPLVDSDSELDFDLDADDFVPPYSPAVEHPDDLELCPPPYSYSAEPEGKRPSVREQLQERRTRILWSCLAIIALYSTLVTLFTTHHRRLPGHGFSALSEDAECAVFSPGSPYSSTQRSSNASFLLSTQAGTELFNEYRGDAIVNGLFVTAFDADGSDDGIYHGDRPRRGEYVRMTVEAVYEGTSDEGPGWDMLQASRVCLRSRDGRRLEHRASERSSSAVRRSGVVLSSVRTAPHAPHSPLYFRLHVQVSRSAAAQPADPVPPLVLQSTEGGVHVADLAGVPLSSVRIRNRAGAIHVENMTAEIAELETTGQVQASVAVAKQLDVHAHA